MLLDKTDAKKINHMRSLLPASPVRVDPPHLTLLRGISSKTFVPDKELAKEVGSILQGILPGDMSAVVSDVRTADSRIYGKTSSVVFEASDKLLRLRGVVIQELSARGYLVEEHEIKEYHPHATITLSVPLPKEKDFSEFIKSGSVVGFSGFALLKMLIGSDGKRLTRIITPG